MPPRWRLRRLSITAALCTAALALALAAPSAEAACPELEEATEPFALWGDLAPYALAKGGSFEGPRIWSGTAAYVLGNEPFLLAGLGLFSTRLRGDETLTSPMLCVNGDHPFMRFVTRALDRESRLVLEMLWHDQGVYKEKVLEEHPADLWRSWRPSKLVPLGGALPVDDNQDHHIRLRFSLKDGAGDWLVDDVFVDPIKRG